MLTFPQAAGRRGRRLSRSDGLDLAAKGAGLTQSPGEVLVYDVADVALEVGEQNAPRAQVLRLCRLSAVLQL